MNMHENIADRLRSKHMRRLLEEHEYVLQSYWAQRFGEGQGGERKGNKGVKRRIGGSDDLEVHIYVCVCVFMCVCTCARVHRRLYVLIHVHAYV